MISADAHIRLGYGFVEAVHIGAPESPEGRMERFKMLVNYILSLVPGNIIEVGAGHGLTTRILCEAAKRHDRKVLVIDPFEDEWSSMPDGYGGYPFSTFVDNTVGYRDQLILCRNNSLSSYAMDAIKNLGEIAFVFLDGLQYKSNVLSELKIMASSNATVICIDDYNRLTKHSEVPYAVNDFLEANKDYKFIYPKTLIEVYLLRSCK